MRRTSSRSRGRQAAGHRHHHAFYFPIGYAAAILLVFAARGARSLNERRRGMVTVSYPGRQVRVPERAERSRSKLAQQRSARQRLRRPRALLDLPRQGRQRPQRLAETVRTAKPSCWRASAPARIPRSAWPASCGRRPTSRSSRSCRRMSAPISCATASASMSARSTYVVSMFVDMRGSTSLSEGRLPFDIVFLINRFVETVSRAVTDAGGEPNQFVGDGVLALFGLDTDPATACRQALRAASLVAVERRPPEPPVRDRGQRARSVRHRHPCRRGHHRRHRLPRPHGVHGAGRFRQRRRPPAGHDEDGSTAGSSFRKRSAKWPGIPADTLTRTDVEIRGHEKPMSVRTTGDPTVLAGLLDTQHAAAAE